MDEVQVRVGDAERRAVDERLQRAVGDGQLTLHEYDERAGTVWAARTRSELDATVHDLPAPVVPPGPVAARGRTRRAVAVLSGDRLTGPVAPGQRLEAYAVLGGACVDLRSGDLPARVDVRAVAVMGGVEVLVPRGVVVQLSGLALMGGRDVTVDAAPPGAPVVQVQAYALMGGIEVKHGGPPGDSTVSLEKTVIGQSGRSPAVRPGSYAVGVPQRRRHRLGRRVVAGVAVAAAAIGLTGVLGADDAAVFSSGVVHAQAGQTRSVGMLFGSQTVVVPDGSRVDSQGTVVFGSTDCEACDAQGSGPVVHVRSRGAFGSVEIITETQYAADQRDDPDDD